MKRSRLFITVCACIISFLSVSVNAGVIGQGTWETTLKARDFDGDTSTIEGWYDTALGITWSEEQTQGYKMSWETANNWAAGLNINGISGWRLPGTDPVDGTAYTYFFKNDGTTDAGYNISAPGTQYAGSTGSEMAHMYYITLGNLGQFDVNGNTPVGWGLTNVGPFNSIGAQSHWSSTDYAITGDLAWAFNFGRGGQVGAYKSYNDHISAWAVHDGSVGAAIVPIPSAVWLFGSGLLGLIGMARRKAA